MDKEQVLQAFHHKLQARITEASHELDLLDAAAAGETKSSAGDKYETAREMIAQARSMQARLRTEAQQRLDWIARQDCSVLRTTIGPGCLITTSQGIFLLGILTDSVCVGADSIQGITTASPIGQALLGKSAGDIIAWRSNQLAVLAVS